MALNIAFSNLAGGVTVAAPVSTSPLERYAGNFHPKPILLGTLLVLATFALYWRVVHYEFLVFDDKPYVTQNVHVNTGLNFGNAVWAFTTFHEGNWHPVTWLSHMADCQWFGAKPGPPHLVNVALHAANVLLLFLLLQRATGAVWRSFFTAALFAVHPLNVETVAWIAERKSLLSALFSLLTIAAYGWYTRLPGWRRYLLVVIAFSLALMSKPMAVSLPLVLLLLDYWPLERHENLPFRRRWVMLSVEKLPLFLMSAASATITMIAQRAGGTIADPSALPLSVRIENAIVSYVAYLGKTIWPSGLSVFYPHPGLRPWSDVIAAAVILIAITAASVYFHRIRYLLMGWCLFLITLVPVIGIVQVGRQAMADRYVYVPCVGLFIIIAWGLCDLAFAAGIPRVIRALAASGVILALGVATSAYLPHWQNGVQLFTRAALVASPPDATIEEALGDALATAGRSNEAYKHYGAACTLRPSYAFCHYNMAEILFNRHQLRDALEQYQIAGRLTDNKDMALSSLITSGEILLALGDYRTAQMRLAAALQIDPSNDMARRLQRQALDQEGPGR
ncbi:MAG: tetratricopeptide repeat protein [Terriglobales bacterium]